MEETLGGSTLGLMKGKIPGLFIWTDSTSLWLAEKDPFACAMLDELKESSVGLSRGQSSSSEGPLFSNSDVKVTKSEDKGMTTKKVCAQYEEVVPCSQPDCEEEIHHDDISPLEDKIDVTNRLNRRGHPVRAASLGVGQYLVAAKAATSSCACIDVGPRGVKGRP